MKLVDENSLSNSPGRPWQNTFNSASVAVYLMVPVQVLEKSLMIAYVF